MIFLKIIKGIIQELKQLKFNLIINYPNSFLGTKIRKSYWRSHLYKCGKNCSFAQYSTIGFPEKIEIGDNFTFQNNCHMTAAGSSGIFIGNHVSIGRSTFIHGSNHNFDDLDKPILEQGTSENVINYNKKKYSIVIEDGVWIGSNVVILSGTHLKKGSIVSAGSVVSSTFIENAIIIGNPGRLLKVRT